MSLNTWKHASEKPRLGARVVAVYTEDGETKSTILHYIDGEYGVDWYEFNITYCLFDLEFVWTQMPRIIPNTSY